MVLKLKIFINECLFCSSMGISKTTAVANFLHAQMLGEDDLHAQGPYRPILFLEDFLPNELNSLEEGFLLLKQNISFLAHDSLRFDVVLAYSAQRQPLQQGYEWVPLIDISDYQRGSGSIDFQQAHMVYQLNNTMIVSRAFFSGKESNMLYYGECVDGAIHTDFYFSLDYARAKNLGETEVKHYLLFLADNFSSRLPNE